jgi:hypothetical protein
MRITRVRDMAKSALLTVLAPAGKAERIDEEAIQKWKRAYMAACIEFGSKLGDPRSSKPAARKVVKLGRRLRDSGEPGRRALLSLLRHDNPWVRLGAANDIAPVNREKALAVLEAMKDLPGKLGVEAEGSYYAIQGQVPPSQRWSQYLDSRTRGDESK